MIFYFLITNVILVVAALFYFSKKDSRKINELKRLHKMRSDFVANVSHELRTPLTSIQGYAELLEQDIQENKLETARESAAAIARNTKRLLDLCSDLLVLSKFEGVKDELVRDWVLGSELVGDVESVLQQKRSEKSHEIVIVGGEVAVFCQRSKGIQVLLNLTDNAIRYMPSGGKIQIEFSQHIFKAEDFQEKYVFADSPRQNFGIEGTLISVIDNGPGIARVHLDRLFERFYRVDKGRSRDMGGTGLGLAIVKHILELHGGWIRVSSDLGQGARFDCFFPGPALNSDPDHGIRRQS